MDWDVLILQPDGTLPDNGIYDALSLSNGASLADPFMLSFIWTGSGTPGAQAFNIYDDTFNVVESGVTSPVPEPAPVFLMLMASGLVGFFAFRKKRLSKITGEKS